ncbi:hypothetical protein OsI_10444 [Oryza sativa Indica Group]|uniref:Uncharacterized protein n=1 Tax=Oryza sativa subsp. indica TaxID=39946 RepID=B8AQF6_ORYSI|nr:hypothetical protein OsI_10444 [Oryza sativa Indica Group]
MEAGRAREEAARGGSLKQARASSGRRGDRAHRAADLLADRGHDEARRSRCTTARSGAAALELWLTVLKSQDRQEGLGLPPRHAAQALIPQTQSHLH